MNRYQKERKARWHLFLRLNRKLKPKVEAAARHTHQSVKSLVEEALTHWLGD